MDTLTAAKRVKECGARLVGVDDGVDTNHPAGKLLLHVLAGLAEEQRDQIRKSWQAAKREAIGRGVHISTHTPFGYRRDTHPRSGKPCGPLMPDPLTAPLVAEAFRLRAEEGFSYAQLVEYLEAETGRRWYLPSVQHMLRNEVYTGVAHNGGYRTENAHPAIVGRSLFEAVRTVRRTNA